MAALADISDTGDFCRACGGHGGHWDDTDRGTKIFERCTLCRGSGHSTVRVDPMPEVRAGRRRET